MRETSAPASAPPFSTLGTVARCIARSLEAEYGIDPLPILLDAGIDPAILQDGERRLPLSVASQLWRRCIEITGEAHFGVRIARYPAPSDLYGVDLALYASATLGEAVRRFAQFTRLLTTVTQPSIGQQADGDWRLGYRVHDLAEPVEAAGDFFIYAQIHMFERQSRLPASQFLRHLELRRSRPNDPSHWQALGVPVSFACPSTAVVFRADAWDRPMLGANPHLLALVEHPILDYLARLGAPLPLSALRARLAEQLGEPPSAAQFARVLGITDLQLQASLREQQVNFAQLLDQTREAQALTLLAMPDLSLDQISSRVGFSNTSALIRAFKRWQGTTPATYRKLRSHDSPR